MVGKTMRYVGGLYVVSRETDMQNHVTEAPEHQAQRVDTTRDLLLFFGPLSQAQFKVKGKGKGKTTKPAGGVEKGWWCRICRYVKGRPVLLSMYTHHRAGTASKSSVRKGPGLPGTAVVTRRAAVTSPEFTTTNTGGCVRRMRLTSKLRRYGRRYQRRERHTHRKQRRQREGRRGRCRQHSPLS